MDGFAKIQSIMKIQELGLPHPETIFIFDFEKQEKEIEEFIKNKELLMIRTDRKENSDNCPHVLDCPKEDAKKAVKELNSKGYAVILSEYVPLKYKEEDGKIIETGDKNAAKFSGNILFLADRIIIDIMEGNPLTLLNRNGIVHEHIQSDNSLEEIFHWGERIAERETLEKIIKMLNGLDLKNKIVEFGVGPNWLYFWQIRDDKSSKMLEQYEK